VAQLRQKRTTLRRQLTYHTDSLEAVGRSGALALEIIPWAG
jgi:hypothetical protein